MSMKALPVSSSHESYHNRWRACNPRLSPDHMGVDTGGEHESPPCPLIPWELIQVVNMKAQPASSSHGS